MSHELRSQNKIYKEKIIKIVEDHTACRHLALVVGKDRPMRWIPATASMQVRLLDELPIANRVATFSRQ